ncbi:MAG: hypothetical protein AAB316_11900 [Bacteroidota bacterium]
MNIATPSIAPPQQKIKIISSENKHEFPEGIRTLFELTEERPYFSDKYWKSQKEDILSSVKTLHRQNPSLPVRQVVLQILSKEPDTLPSWNIHRIIGYITQTWKELSQAEEAPEPDWK